MEFFICFFGGHDEDVEDEVKMKLIEDYESLKDALSIKNMV